MIQNGDFCIGNSDEQHIEALVKAKKGEFKEYPALGFGAALFLKGNVTEIEFKRDLKVQLQYENYHSVEIEFTETGDLKINL